MTWEMRVMQIGASFNLFFSARVLMREHLAFAASIGWTTIIMLLVTALTLVRPLARREP